MSRRRHRLRRFERSDQPCREAASGTAQLLDARGFEYASADDISGCHPKRESGDRRLMADVHPSQHGDPDAAVNTAGSRDVIAPGYTFGSVTDKISAIVLTQRTSVGWYLGFLTAAAFTVLLLISLTYLTVKGIGIWGNDIPVGWAFDITNFVWWIGIRHAGTLISAILLLLKQS